MVALVDGYICSVAALCAVRLNPACRDWLLFAHSGAEPGHRHVLEALAAQPLLDLGLRLGEGSGAALAVPLLRQACALHAGMATFAEAAVSTAWHEPAPGPPAAWRNRVRRRFPRQPRRRLDRAWLGADAHGGGRRTLGPAGQLAIATLPRLRRGTGAAPGIELELENDLRELHFGAWEGARRPP